MYCTKCGKYIPDHSRVCPLCGADLSYEANALKNAPSEKKSGRKSHAGGIITAFVVLLAAAECVWFIGLKPVRIPAGSAVSEVNEANVSEGQGITDLIPTYAPESTQEAAAQFEEIEEPTPTPTVTPAATIAPAEVSRTEENAPAEETEPEPEPETEEPETYEEPEPEPEAEETPVPEEEPAPEETPAPTDDSYFIPDSSDAEISDAQLEGMSAEELRIARNEIYARHGLIFKSEDLNEYFSNQAWYNGTVTDADSIQLSETEAENIQKIVDYEAAHGYNQ